MFIDASTMGTCGNGQADDSVALQKALDLAFSRNIRQVRIPSGLYRIGQTLLVPNGVHVLADENAVFKLADHAGVDQTVFLITNRDQKLGADITVEGGVWDGNNPANPRGPDGPVDSYSGVVMNFVNVDNLNLRDLSVRDPESFFIRIGQVTNFHIENITFMAPHVRLNQDALHVGGFCRNGLIRNLKGVGPNCPNDDMVAINADDDVTRAINLGMKQGPISDIRIENLKADFAYTFVRLLSQDSPISRISIDGIEGGCSHYAINLNKWRFPLGKGQISGVNIENVNVSKMPSSNKDALVHITLCVQDLSMRCFQRGKDGRADVPTLHIANGARNYLDLDGLTTEQQVVMRHASKLSCKHGNNKTHFEMAGDDQLVLPDGGFDHLVLHS